MAYFFSTVRFVPDPAAGEFINLGAIVGTDDSSDWALRQISNPKRANAIDLRGTFPSALEFIGRLQEQLPAEDGDGDGDELTIDALRLLSAEMNNIVQVSEPTPIVADSAEAALDLIFAELIVDPAATQFRFAKKHGAIGATRRAYRDHDVPAEAIKERVQVVAGRFQGNFDFAVHNGRAVQLVQCWSFQLPNQAALAEQLKAWAWVVRELREHGGQVHADTQLIAAADQLEVGSVYIPPATDGPRAAFEEAEAAFEELNVVAVTSDAADGLGVRAAAALSTAAGT